MSPPFFPAVTACILTRHYPGPSTFSCRQWLTPYWMANPSHRNGPAQRLPPSIGRKERKPVMDPVRNENLQTLGPLFQVGQDLVQQLGHVALKLPAHPLPLTW